MGTRPELHNLSKGAVPPEQGRERLYQKKGITGVWADKNNMSPVRLYLDLYFPYPSVKNILLQSTF